MSSISEDQIVRNLNYDYINEELIDKELKCSLCFLPFTAPVSTPCQHAFCMSCITQWLNKNSSCALCRSQILKKDLTSINVLFIANMLNRLQVKCKACGKTDMRRDEFMNHVKNECPKVIVRCLASPMDCPWNGSRDQLYNHMTTCPFNRLQKIIFELMSINKSLTEKNAQYEFKIKELTEQLRLATNKVNEKN
ncbi:unnamed protein product [Rotaria sp. Silwood1]|nr:unnamed protein product [Rotaria sp. Silwood1]CAF1594238.1 unnamed protein product [Rotaria sp. Silwood1]CAF3747577.1 unnamed protein product [Rotaria sp. Silwood1]CAF3800671.1 unnamed protein product [Rotaria sp. Silwood1]CAF3847128.1 unnamed protein product [Rotaria sp. Silwood1]